MTTFRRATGTLLADQIRVAKDRVIFMAPGVSETVAKALVETHDRPGAVTVILDVDEDVCRIGYGEVDGFKCLRNHAGDIELRKHSGVRLGLLIADEVVTIWSPTPQAVDSDRNPDQPNAIVIEATISEGSAAVDAVQTETPHDAEIDTMVLGEGTATASPLSFAEKLARRLDDENVGEECIRPEELQQVVKELDENPPAPFDLTRRVRVFSTKFQYVETELRGLEWTERRIKLSSLLLNSDLPNTLQDIFQTQIHPYRTKSDVRIDVPCIVAGQVAYNKHREEIRVPMNQRDIENIWKDIRDRYLFRIPGFGTLVRKRELASFRAEAEAFEYVLQEWVAQFRQHVNEDRDGLVSEIVDSIKQRIELSDHSDDFHDIDLDQELRSGLEGMRDIEPRVRIVIKDVSWESSRDREFTSALQEAVPAEDLQGWFDEFVAAQERR